jgi:type IV pilus assembly protein PilV
LRNTQASFIAHDMIERIRANPDANYSLGSLSQAPTSSNHDNPRQQDLFDFAVNVKQLAGESGEGRIFVTGNAVTVEIDWSDARGAQKQERLETFTLSSIVSASRSDRP